jgi:predicted DNA-binding transcriptional regulator AlpA
VQTHTKTADKLGFYTDPLVTVRDLATALGCHKETVKAMGRDGRLPPPITIGKRRYWRQSAIESFLANGGQKPAATAHRGGRK